MATEVLSSKPAPLLPLAPPPATGDGASTTTRAAAAAVARSPYFVHPFVDFLAVGGLSLLAFAAFFVWPWPEVAAAQTAVLLSWFCNYPHFAATSYRLYHSRENIRQYPLTAWGAPLIVGLFALGSFLSPLAIAPAFLKLYILWSPYHFSAQSVGITMIYARRCGVKIEGNFRRTLTWYVFSSFIAMSALAEVGLMDIHYFGVPYPRMGLPPVVGQTALAWMVLSCAAFTLYVVRWSRQNGRLFPLIIVLPGITQIVWFVLGANFAAYNVFVPFFHSMQYLLIAWVFHIKERHDLCDGTRANRGATFLTRESLTWIAVIVVTGAFLFEGLPRAIGHVTNVSLPFAFGIILAAVQIHHFFVDGVVWKLRNARVSSPLMLNLDDLLAPPIDKPEPKPTATREAAA